MPTDNKSVTILVADDDASLLDGLEIVLERSGYQVLTARSGQDAIQIATTHEIDLALLDYRMPGASGLEAGTAIYSLSSARFILMSNHSDEKIITQAASNGALGFLVKPLDVKEVLAQVAIALTRASEIRQLQTSVTNTNLSVRNAIANGRTVNIAAGILMERLKRPYDEVYKVLLDWARRQRRRLEEVSADQISSIEEYYRCGFKEPVQKDDKPGSDPKHRDKT